MCWELSFFFPLVNKGINLLVNDLDLENKLYKLWTQASYTKTFDYFHLKTVIQEEKEKIIYREKFESHWFSYFQLDFLILHSPTTITTNVMRQMWIILLAITTRTGLQGEFKPLQGLWKWVFPPFVTFLGTVSRKRQEGKSGLSSKEPWQKKLICSWWSHTVPRKSSRRDSFPLPSPERLSRKSVLLRAFTSSLYLDFPTSLTEHVLEKHDLLPKFIIFPNLIPDQLLTVCYC